MFNTSQFYSQSLNYIFKNNYTDEEILNFLTNLELIFKLINTEMTTFIKVKKKIFFYIDFFQDILIRKEIICECDEKKILYYFLIKFFFVICKLLTEHDKK